MRFVAVMALMSTGLVVYSPQQEPTKKQQGPDIGSMLQEGLKKSDGCIGVDSGQMRSGKTPIFAWFKDVESVKTWYHSEVHRRVVRMAGADPDAHEPLAHVKEYKGPVMVIATITPTRKGTTIPGIPMPVTQISVELFRALPGGAHVNGRLSPKKFKVPHMKDLGAAYGQEKKSD